MTAAAATNSSESLTNSGGSPPAGWEALRADGNVQFAPVSIPEIPPREPSWFERMLNELFKFLADLVGPVGEALGASWWWLQWVLLGLAVIIALVLLARLLGPGFGRFGNRAGAEVAAEEWRPDTAASLALLEDADRLAAQGRFDDATHLLLQRSVGHISAARPDAARAAFRVIAERVERSLFALRSLERADWEAARAAYAEFALARLDVHGRAA